MNRYTSKLWHFVLFAFIVMYVNKIHAQNVPDNVWEGIRFYNLVNRAQMAEPAPGEKNLSGTHTEYLDAPVSLNQLDLDNTGQLESTPRSDMDILQSWGIEYSHEDLAANMWTNQDEIPGNGNENDNNGYVDNIHGYWYSNNSPEISPKEHGLHVAGTIVASTGPVLSASADFLVFQDVFVGDSAAVELRITNDGTEILEINDFIFNSEGFFIDPVGSMIKIMPFETYILNVCFVPPDIGGFVGELTIVSNDQEHPSLMIPLFVYVIEPPEVVVYPDSLSVIVKRRDTTSTLLHISNVGVADLKYELKAVSVTSFDQEIVSGGDGYSTEFETLAPGNINGQDGWYGDRDNFEVSNIDPYSGSQHLLGYPDGLGSGRIISPVFISGGSEGFMTFKMKMKVIEKGNQWNIFPQSITDNVGIGTLVIGSENNLYMVTRLDDGEYYSFTNYELPDGYFELTVEVNKADTTITVYIDDEKIFHGMGFSPHAEAFIIESVNATTAGKISIDDFRIYNHGEYISIDPESGVIPSGESVDIEVAFIATSLDEGEYKNNLYLYHNDPEKGTILIPSRLTVMNASVFSIDTETIEDILVIGDSATHVMNITNIGLTPLTFQINDLLSNEYEESSLTITPTAGQLLPGESMPVRVKINSGYMDIGSNTEMLEIVTDDPANPSVYISVLVEVLSPCVATGTLLREYWKDIIGLKVENIPLEELPDGIEMVEEIFAGPVNWGNNYGARISGYLCVPQTGEYVFKISSDGNSELYISIGDPAEKFKVAEVVGYTLEGVYDKYPEQTSAPIYLKKGNSYYVEVLHNESDGRDHVSVGWIMPDGRQQIPIESAHFSPSVENYRESVDLQDVYPGLFYKYYEVNLSELPEVMDENTLVKTGAVSTFNIDKIRNVNDYFVIEFFGYIYVPEDDVYRFYTLSNEGCQLLIGDELIIDNNGLNGTTENHSSILLKAGYHPVTVRYLESDGLQALKLSWSSSSIKREEIPSERLFNDKNVEIVTAVDPIIDVQFKVFPNPVNESMNIRFVSDVQEFVHFSLIDVTGRAHNLGQQYVSQGENAVLFDLKNQWLKKGFYILNMQSDSRQYSRVKIMVE